MKEELKNVKELLFDAPIEVKKAFNQVIEYFAKSNEFYIVEYTNVINKSFVKHSILSKAEAKKVDKKLELNKSHQFSNGGGVRTLVKGPMSKEAAEEELSKFER